MPPDLTPNSKNIIEQFLDKQAHKRLGSSVGDFEDVKKHAFFQDIDWDKLSSRQYAPPFVPRIENELDTSNFCDEFTSQTVQLTPHLLDAKKQIDLSSCKYNFFDSYSYYGSSRGTSFSSSRSSLRSHHVMMPEAQFGKMDLSFEAADKFDSMSLVNEHASLVSLMNRNSASSEHLAQLYSLRRSSNLSSECIFQKAFNMKQSMEHITTTTDRRFETQINLVNNSHFHSSSLILAANAFPNFIQLDQIDSVAAECGRVINENWHSNFKNSFCVIEDHYLLSNKSPMSLPFSSSASSDSYGCEQVSQTHSRVINTIPCLGFENRNNLFCSSSGDFVMNDHMG